MTLKTTTLIVGGEAWTPTEAQIEAIVAAYKAAEDPDSTVLATPTEVREQRLAEAMDTSVNDVRKMIQDEGAAHARQFLDRYREKAHEQIAHAAFHEFFELASKLNESAAHLGIRNVVLDADAGNVSVTYRSRTE